jgi:hypothetical protein
MLNEFLNKKFSGKNIDDLISFLNDLDENYSWDGGICESGLPITYSRSFTEYFVLYERKLQNCIFVKCKKKPKSISEIVVNMYDNTFDLIVDSMITINYDLENLKIINIQKELEELNATTI